jgi:hypothetical protein
MRRLVCSVVVIFVAAVAAACGDAPAQPRPIDPAIAVPSFDVAATTLTSEEACRIILTGGQGTISDPARINSLCASLLFRRTLCFVGSAALSGEIGQTVTITLPLFEGGRFVRYVVTATRTGQDTVSIRVTRDGQLRYNNPTVTREQVAALCS